MKRIITLFLCTMLFLPSASAIFVEDGNSCDVSIDVESRNEIYTKNFTAEVVVTFYNHSLINNQLYLSYQILSADGSVLLEEANRVLLTPDETGICKTEIEITPAVYGVESVDAYNIRFDIVDTANLYWIGRSETQTLHSGSIHYIHDPSTKFVNDIIWGFQDAPVISFLNVCLFLCTISGIMIIKKRSVKK